MEGRHVRMLGIGAFLLALLLGVGCHMFVVFHYHHVWSVMCVMALCFAAIIAPALCFGYDMETPYYMMRDMALSEQAFLNCRDLGWIVCGLFALLTYVLVAVAWYSSGGASPPLGGALVAFAGNTCLIVAFMGWLRVFIFVA